MKKESTPTGKLQRTSNVTLFRRRDPPSRQDWDPNGPGLPPEVRAEILLRVESGESVIAIFQDAPSEWPDIIQFNNALRMDKSFAARYERALDVKYKTLADHLVDIAHPEGPLANYPVAERKLLMDAIKYVASKRCSPYRDDPTRMTLDDASAHAEVTKPYIVVPQKAQNSGG